MIGAFLPSSFLLYALSFYPERKFSIKRMPLPSGLRSNNCEHLELLISLAPQCLTLTNKNVNRCKT
jgi:hypothetical protein